MPAAQYWPNGVLPVGVTVTDDYARDTSGQTYGPSGHDAAWHIERGYEWTGEFWASAILLRQNEAHAQAIEAAREFRSDAVAMKEAA
jgi:hypothetical protein